MPLKDKLEIILITYNRKQHLQNTFNQIFAEDSPIKNFPITILDNKSTDGTSELIEEYRIKFPNIKHIINNRNIGGNANIARAFEIASKEYVWILCDDDEYDFTHWKDVEKAIEENYDAIVVANYANPGRNLAQLIGQMTFVPAAIYKTENITDTVMVNCNFNIFSMFPQLAIVTHLINEKKNIKILDNWIVKMVPHGGEETYTRGLETNKHPLMSTMFWQCGFLHAIKLIKDNKLREAIIKDLYLDGQKAFANFFLYNQCDRIGKDEIWNYVTIFANLPPKNRFSFTIFCLFLTICRFLGITFESRPYDIRIHILGIKTKIWDRRKFAKKQ